MLLLTFPTRILGLAFTHSLALLNLGFRIDLNSPLLKNSSSSLEVVMAEDEVEMLFSLEDILLINYRIYINCQLLIIMRSLVEVNQAI